MVDSILQALIILVGGLASITCLAVGWKILKCPDHIYNKHRDKLRLNGFLTKQEWDESFNDILG